MNINQEHDKKSLLELLQEVRLEEIVIDIVCRNLDIKLKTSSKYESVKFYLTYQEAFHKDFIDQIKNLFVSNLKSVFKVMKEDIIKNFVNH